MNFVRVIRFSRRLWRWITTPLALAITILIYAVALFPALFVLVLAFLRGKRITKTNVHERPNDLHAAG